MDRPAVAVTSAPLELAALTAEVARSATAAGAICTFAGLVREHNQGRQVRFLEYEAYEPLAVLVLARIVEEARATWPGVTVGLHHRIGRLEIGEASIIIVAASSHRAEAFAACRYAIERVKQIAPIWKREHFEGGEVWLEGATADPEDEAARQAAQNRMRVTVRLFARLKDLAGAGELVRDVPAPATVQTVWEGLTAEMPALLEYERTLSVAVNAEYARMAAAVRDGDEVAFLPPVSGG